jgi:hypothetical protein
MCTRMIDPLSHLRYVPPGLCSTAANKGDEGQAKGAPLTVWRFYNARSRAELIIRELKAAYVLNKIPIQDFGGIETFFQLVLLAYNLLTCFRRL